MTTGPRPERDVEIAMMANRAHHDAAQAAGDAAAQEERHQKAGRDLVDRVRRQIEDGGPDHGDD
ncbi:hypothetical protein D3C72_315690 [compost metagenome]